jgi:aerobic C4-dicarboxylate transport protein
VFKVFGYIIKLAPLGAFGAMAYAIGEFGLDTLTSLGSLIALFYLTSAFFVFVVLGSVMLYLKLNIFHLLRYLKEELLIILGTSTAEPALPGLMAKMEHAGVEKSTVGLVVPTGYSFNLDGAAIYLSLAALYIAQATNTDLSIGEQLGLLGIMLLTSKGAAGVAGGGFTALTATLASVGPSPRRASCSSSASTSSCPSAVSWSTSSATRSRPCSSPSGTRTPMWTVPRRVEPITYDNREASALSVPAQPDGGHAVTSRS